MKPTNIPAKGNENNSKYIYDTIIIQIRKCFSCNGMVSKSFSSDINKTTKLPARKKPRNIYLSRDTVRGNPGKAKTRDLERVCSCVNRFSPRPPMSFLDSCPNDSRVKLRLTRISTGLGERRCPGKAPVMPYSFLSPQPPYDTKKPLRWEEREQPKSKQLKRNLKNSGLTGTLR